MRCANIFPGLVASACFITGTVASPCKPKPTQQFSDSLVSSVTQTSSLGFVSTADATSTVAEILSSTTIGIGVTFTETVSTEVTPVGVSSIEATSQATSGATSGATTDTSADTTALTTVTTGTTADTTTWFAETSTVEATTTSEAPPSFTTFSLSAADSPLTLTNENWVLIHESLAMSVERAPNLGSESHIAQFSIEPETNYLMMFDLYVIAPEEPSLKIGLSRTGSGARFIVCTPPVAKGEILSCEDHYGDWSRWAVDSSNDAMYLRWNLRTASEHFVDLIVS